jgi:hypothetical protein
MALNLSPHYEEQLLQFKNNTLERLIRQDLGSAGFVSIKEKLQIMVSMLNELLLILTNNADIPDLYWDSLFYYIQEFNGHANNLNIFSTEDVNNSIIKRNYIGEVEELYNYMLTGMPNSKSYTSMPFITLYTVLKQLHYDKAASQILNVQNDRDEFLRIKSETQALLISLQEKAKEVSLHDYAEVFSKQAKLHSNWGWNLGAGQTWLFVTMFFIGLFCYFVYNIDSLFPIEIEKVNATVITIEYITRVLIVSFQIYIITFCAKQFNIQQHLATVNKHRENTLNSYKLFIDSLGDTDSEIKPALMMEVAKAIYDSGQTGYLGSNDKSEGSPSLIEMTKYVSSK